MRSVMQMYFTLKNDWLQSGVSEFVREQCDYHSNFSLVKLYSLKFS